ncbi:MAG: hypothetical protein LBH65_02335 [Desulfovibrio sp.]|jgi:hypothetical protein|nr:hypothetical protein [Desulfovibrio sp.]
MPDGRGNNAARAGLVSGEGQRLILPLIIAAACLTALALTLVWLNIERTKLAYRERILQQRLDRELDLNAKLGVERELLLSPHELGKKAEVLGLGTARPGQIRRLEQPLGGATP